MKQTDAKEKIIEATTALIREGGGMEITTRDIANRAGVGVGLVNYHFQTKENLLNICTQRIISLIIAGFDTLYSSLDMAPIDKLRFLVKENMKFLIKNPGISRMSIISDMLCSDRGDNTSQTLNAYFPVIKEVCGNKATENELLLLHTLIFTLQVAFLRGEVFKDSAHFDLKDDMQRDKFLDSLIDMLFSNYR